jgi:hypothetical protein
MALAEKPDLGTLIDGRVRLPGPFGANAGPKAVALVAGMLTFGHVREPDAAASRWLQNLAAVTPIVAVIGYLALVDIGASSRNGINTTLRVPWPV